MFGNEFVGRECGTRPERKRFGSDDAFVSCTPVCLSLRSIKCFDPISSASADF